MLDVKDIHLWRNFFLVPMHPFFTAGVGQDIVVGFFFCKFVLQRDPVVSPFYFSPLPKFDN